MIYFVQDSQSLAIKIGYAASPEDRVAALQTANASSLCLLASIPGGRSDEAELHRRFAAARLVGEWFRPTPELIVYLLGAAWRGGLQHDDSQFKDFQWVDGVLVGPDGVYTCRPYEALASQMESN